MSLESAIRENTAALQALTVALSVGRPSHVDLDPPPAPEVLHAGNSNDKNIPAVAQGRVLEAAPASQLNYDTDVKPSVLRLAAKDKATLRRILDSYGVAKGSEVEPHNLPMLLARIQESL